MLYDYVLGLLLFLFTCNLYSNAAIFGILFFILCLRKNKLTIPVSINLLLLVSACLSYLLVYYVNYGLPQSSVLFSRVIGPVLLFLSGSIIGKYSVNIIRVYGLVISFGMAFHAILNMIINNNAYSIYGVGRELNDIWGGTIAATGQNLLMTMITALMFYFVFYEKGILKLCGISCVFLSIMGTLMNGSRTLIYILVLTFLTIWLISVLKQNSNLKVFKLAIEISLAFSCIAIVVSLNIFNINDYIYNSSLFMRYDGNIDDILMKTDRVSLSSYVLENLWDYPFGNIPVFNYAHNLWLDIAVEVGWIPMIFHFLFFIFSFFNSILYVKNSYNCRNGILLFSLIFAMSLQFFVEPILIGNPYFYMCFCFISGEINTALKQSFIFLSINMKRIINESCAN